MGSAAGAPPRMLLVSHMGEVLGGAERSLTELAIRLLAEPVDVVVGVPALGGVSARIEAAGGRTVVLPAPTWIVDVPPGRLRSARTAARVLLALVRCLLALPRTVAAIRSVQPDVVVTNTSAVPTAAVACRLLGIPHVWFVRELLPPAGRHLLALPTRGVLGLVGRLSVGVVVASEAVARSLDGRVACPIRQVAPGCEIPSGPRPVDGDRAGALHLVCVGRVEPEKGLDVAIRAMAVAARKGAPLDLRIVGHARHEVRATLEALVEREGLTERVTFVGRVDDPTDELDASDVFVMPSAHEGYGRVTIEALRRGKPVVGVAAAGTLELVRHGENGLLVEGTAEALAAALQRLDEDRPLVARLADAAWSAARTDFDPATQARLFLTSIEQLASLLSRRPGHGRLLRAPGRRRRWRWYERLSAERAGSSTRRRAADAAAPLVLGGGVRVAGEEARVPVDGLELRVPRRFLWHFYARPYEPLLVDWLRRALPPGGVAVDVGAHVGYITLQMARTVGPNGRVVAVEPGRESARLVERNAAANGLAQVRVIPTALAETCGTRPFLLNASSDSSGFYEHPNAPTVEMVTVEVCTLDHLVLGGTCAQAERVGLDRLDVVKIDAEGAETEILAGGAEALARFPDVRLAVEWNPKVLAARGLGVDVLSAALRAAGHDVVVLDEARGRVVEVDTMLADLSADETLAARWYGTLATRLP